MNHLHYMAFVDKIVNCLYKYSFDRTFLDTDIQNQQQDSSTIILLVCFGIVVVVSVIVITILTIISIKRRRGALSQDVNTRHYIKPPTGDCNLNVTL